MKRHVSFLRFASLLLGLSLLSALVLGGCGAAGQEGAPSSPGSSAQPSNQPSAATAGSHSGTIAQELLPPGTWLSDQGQYYFFDEGANSGRTSSLKNGTGTPFAYTFDGHQAVFSLGMAGNNYSCDITVGENTLILQWESGTAETLTYVSNLGSDEFTFYSDRELEELALAYYKAQNPSQDTDSLTAAAQANEDGSVTIQVYQNLGDHNSTAAWYAVDRLTAQGTDVNSGAAVDLAL